MKGAQAKGKAGRRRARSSAEFALAPHQLLAAKDPRAPIRTVLDEQPEQFAGRPYSLWREDPELARALNERLAEAAD